MRVVTSKNYRVRVADLPSVKEIHVTYHFPKWTGMKPVSEDHSGDLRAIEGTDATVDLEMSRPLQDGQLAIDGGHTIRLTPGAGNHYQGLIHMEKDGAYHIAAMDARQAVPAGMCRVEGKATSGATALPGVSLIFASGEAAA